MKQAPWSGMTAYGQRVRAENNGMAETALMVLVIEDDDEDAALIQRILEQTVPTRRMHRASAGKQAIELLANWKNTPPQLVLLDLHLPTRSGLEVLRCLRETQETRHVPVIVMAESVDREDVARSYDLGANSFICKADRAEQFEQTMMHLFCYWLELNQPYVLPRVKR